jgi:hypothetical protein
MLIFIISFVLAYFIDALIVGIAFQSLKRHFQWKISPSQSFLLLFIVFAFFELYQWPMFNSLDITFTVHNQEMARAFGFKPGMPLSDLFQLGVFEIFMWSVQALLASFLGERIIGKRSETE